MTTNAYKPLTIAEQIFKDLIWTPGIRAGELALEGAVPFFAIPGIKELDETVITQMTDWLFGNFVLLVDVTSIRLVSAQHQSAYETASLQLRVLAVDKGVDSDEFLQARNAAKIALSKFTQLSH